MADSIVFDGDVMYPIKYYNDNVPLKVSKEIKSSELWKKLIDWVKDYDQYVSLDLKELSKIKDRVEKLDSEGQSLTLEFANSGLINGNYRFYYFSLCFDKLVLVYSPE